MDSQRKARLVNQVERYRAACLQIRRVHLIDEAMDEIEAIVKRLEFFADAATGKSLRRANANKARSSVIPFHPMFDDADQENQPS